MSDANRIVLDHNNTGHHEEGVLDTVATPGMNVVLASDGKFDPGAGVASATLPSIVVENANTGGSIDTVQAVGDVFSYFIPNRGDRINLILLDGQVIVIGDLLKADAAGKFIKTATAPAQFIAEEALSPSGSDGRISGRAL